MARHSKRRATLEGWGRGSVNVFRAAELEVSTLADGGPDIRRVASRTTAGI
jgi:hypothetical protein